jgi:hypothetical protein
MWLYNQKRLGDFFADGKWLTLCLHRILQPVRPWETPSSHLAYLENAAQELLKLYNAEQMFSIVPFQLAKTETQENPTHATSELQLQG